MDAIQRRALSNGVPPPFDYGQPSRFGGLSEYGQPGCERESDVQRQDVSLPSTVKAGSWKELVGDAKRKWPRLSKEDLEWAGGDIHKLSGLIQLGLPISAPEADQQARDFFAVHGIPAGSSVASF